MGLGPAAGRRHLRPRVHPDHDHPGVADRAVDGAAAALPHALAHIHPRFRTPDVSTWLVAGIASAWYVLANIISENALLDSLTALSLLIAFYYALTGIACAVYYRRQLRRSLKNLLLIGVGPVIGSILLIWLLIRSVVDLNDPEASYTGAAWFGLRAAAGDRPGDLPARRRDHGLLASAGRQVLEGAGRDRARPGDRRSGPGRPGHGRAAERGSEAMTGKSVVLGLDRSPGAEKALALAVRLAGSLDVPLVLVHGVAPPGGVGEEAGEAREAIEEVDDAVIGPAVAAAEAAGVRTVVQVVDDRPAQALVAAADAARRRGDRRRHLEREPAARPAARVGGAQASSAVGPAGALRAGRRFLTVSRPRPSPAGPGRALRAQTAPGCSCRRVRVRPVRGPASALPRTIWITKRFDQCRQGTAYAATVLDPPPPDPGVPHLVVRGLRKTYGAPPCARCAGPISPCGPVSSSR